MNKFTICTTYTEIDCLRCHAFFAIPKVVGDNLRETHESFYCPYCRKGMLYPKKTESEKLTQQLKQTKSALAQEQECCIEAREETNNLEQQLKRTRAGYKGAIVSLKKRMKCNQPI